MPGEYLLEVNHEKKSISTLGRTILGDTLVEGEWYIFHLI